MQKIIGVRFRTAGKVYYFDPLELEIKKGEGVIVETARGMEYGTAVAPIREMPKEEITQPLKPVLRIATERDKKQQDENAELEREAIKVCYEKIKKHGLEMKLIDAEYTFDRNKILFYFTADGRIDFRELVKDLAYAFHTRIELRQIGVRDETKILGGFGVCGRPVCCHTFLPDFAPVSIKMAKEQNLSLNPTKISGVCGRLMCCLKNEAEAYEELNKNLPRIGDYVTAEDGTKGEVHSVNVLRQLVKVVIDTGEEKEIREYPVDELRFRRRGKKGGEEAAVDGDLKELEKLEKDDTKDGEEKSGRQSGERSDRGDRGNRSDRGNRGDRGNRDNRNRNNRNHRDRNDFARPNDTDKNNAATAAYEKAEGSNSVTGVSQRAVDGDQGDNRESRNDGNNHHRRRHRSRGRRNGNHQQND